MDRFKFRIWDTEIKEYLVGCFLVGGSNMIHNSVDYESFLNKGNFVIEQCTGLKDKNDNLIYEGDIVSDGYHKGVVKYGEFNCSCCDGVYGWYFDGGDIRETEYYEIVGNTHEQKDNK